MNKHISRILLMAAIASGLSSCQDFLTVEEKGKVVIPSFLSSPDGLNAALTGTYNKLYGYRDAEFTKYGDVAGNMLTLINSGEGADMVDQYNFTSDPSQEIGAVGAIWSDIYECMANANNVIQYAPQIAEDFPAKADYCTRIKAEALFIRALCHFDLVQCYAQAYNYTADASHLGVPVLTITPGPDDNPSRGTVAQVYQRIIDDLNSAISDFENKEVTNYHYVTPRAVHALASRAYLYKEDWAKAYSEAVIAIDGESLPAGSAYSQIWTNLDTATGVIFRLAGNDRNSKLKEFYTTVAVPADTLISLFDADDIRLTALRNASGTHCSKYDAMIGNEVKRNDPIVLRLAEQYLNAAEAACMLSDYTNARLYIKAILSRAVNASYAENLLAQTQDSQLLSVIRKERQKELFGEGHNFFDIRRWNQDLIREWKTNSTVREMKYPDDRFVLPISQYELNANTSIQPNPGVNQ